MYNRYKDVEKFRDTLHISKSALHVFHLNIRTLRKHYNELLVLLHTYNYKID